MTCRDILEDASAFLDGQLPPERRASVERHLEACPECAAEFDSLTQATGFVAARLREIEPSPALWRSIETAIAPPRPRPASARLLDLFSSHSLRFAAAGAALALALGPGMYSLVQYRQSRASLERYMAQYVQARDAGQPAPARTLQLVPPKPERVIRVQFTENPFAEDDILGAFENPFQAEGH